MHINPQTDDGFYVGEGETTFIFPAHEAVTALGAFVSCSTASSTRCAYH